MNTEEKIEHMADACATEIQVEEWIMLDDEQWTSWKRMHLLAGKKHLLRWGQIPAASACEIKRLRVVAASRALDDLPESIGALEQLEHIEFDKRFLKKLKPGTIPPSVITLRISGEGSATWPKAVSLPHVRRINAGSIALRFTYAQFPGLNHITIKLANNAVVLDIVKSYRDLSCLDVVTVNSADFFTSVATLPLRHLGISGGKVDSIVSIGELTKLEWLALNNLPHLTSLTGLARLVDLRELSITYCMHLKDINDILTLRSLRRLSIIGCKDIGLGALRPAIEAMGLEHLDTSGTS
jgi:hypothetical protein